MKVSLRQKELLQCLVGEYILSARPVSSGLLEEKFELDVSPATIRAEMKQLTDAGYLFQPHTSAGRVPTDKGYRFFVELLREDNGWSADLSEIEEIIAKMDSDFSCLFSGLSRFLASSLSAFCLSGFLEPPLFFKEGWSEVTKKPEFQEYNYVVNFAQFIKDFENELERFDANANPQIYIGKESSLRGASEFSIIIARCDIGKRKGVVAILGPKRMEYRKNTYLISAIQQLLEGF